MTRMKKKGVSEMVAYVLLITIAMGLAITVFSYIIYYTDIFKEKKDCNEGTSVSLEEYTCSTNNMELKIKNNGLFNVDGIIVQVSKDSTSSPRYELKSTDLSPNYGKYSFQTIPGSAATGLKPNEIQKASFSNEYKDSSGNLASASQIYKISIQPFILDKNSAKPYTVCTNTRFITEIKCDLT